MDYVSLVLMTHLPEFRYVDEWIAHHASLGVERFYICLDGGGDYRSADPRVQVFHTTQSQEDVYRSMLHDHGHASQWMGFIDTDEFIRLVGERCLHSLLRDYEQHSALAVNWLCFGTSGHATKQPAVLPAYVMRAAEDHALNRHVKSFVQPSQYVAPSGTPHNFITKGLTVNSRGEKVTGPFGDWVGERVRLHHYYTRSREDWEVKVQMLDADSGPLGRRNPFGRNWEGFRAFDEQCTIEDRTLAGGNSKQGR